MGASGPWDRFSEVRESLSLEWAEGIQGSAHRGRRRGCGTRSREARDAIVFTSRDGIEPDAEAELGDPVPGLESTALKAGGYLDQIRESAAREAGKPVHLSAIGHFYRQRILYEAAGRRASDTRNGAWLEMRAWLPGGGTPVRLVLADETLNGLINRMASGEAGRVLGERCREQLGEREAVRVNGEVLPVVFAAGGCEALVHEIGHLFEGEASGPGARSFKAGERIAPAMVTLRDDPSAEIPGRGRYRIDDEGVAPGSVTLIERGRVADRIQGGSLPSTGASPRGSGHGRRASFRDLPQARMACTIFEAGGDDPRDIVAHTRQGIFVRRLGTGSMDPASGRVTLSVTEGFLIENGNLTHPLAPSLLVSDVASLLDSIDAVGSDLINDHGATNCVRGFQQLPVMVGQPTIRIGMIKVISP